MQEHIVDIVLIAIFALLTFKYYRQGLIGTIMKFGSVIVSLVAAKLLCGTVTDWVYSNTKLFSGTERYLAKMMIFVLLYIVIKLVFSRVISILGSFKKLPVIKQANKLLGAALGAGCGIVAVLILSVVLQVSSHVVYNAKYVNAVDSSVIVQTVLSNEKITENIQALKEYGGI